MELSYRQTFQIPQDGLSPEFIMQSLQKTAEEHATQMGLGRDDLLSGGNCVWMIARSRYTLTADLTDAQSLTVETWPSGADAVQCYRGFFFYHEGKIVGEASQSWLLVDIDERRILPTKLFPILGQTSNPERPKASRLRHIVLPELSSVMQVRISEKDIDLNGHMNNARYLSYAMLPTGKQTASDVRIDFERELVAGDTVELFAGVREGQWYIQGKMENGLSAFCTVIRL